MGKTFLVDREIPDFVPLQNEHYCLFSLYVLKGKERGRLYQLGGLFGESASIRERFVGIFEPWLAGCDEYHAWTHLPIKEMSAILPETELNPSKAYQFKISSQKETTDEKTGQKFVEIIGDVLRLMSDEIVRKNVKLVLYGSYRMRKVRRKK